jgi:hypothetical protein
MKTDPRVKSQTQRDADKALKDMFQANRGLKPKWTPKPPHVKVKRKKKKVKVRVSMDIETLQFLGAILICVCMFGLLFLSYSYSFGEMSKPEIRVMPELK